MKGARPARRGWSDRLDNLVEEGSLATALGLGLAIDLGLVDKQRVMRCLEILERLAPPLVEKEAP